MKGSAEPFKPPTLEEYWALERTSPLRHEYHGDRIVAMAGGSLSHGRIGRNLTAAFERVLADRPCESFNSDMRICVRKTGKYYFPDASALCGPPEIDHGGGFDSLCNPQVLVEVLSPTSDRFDRDAKFDAYSLIPTLREYVLIAQDEPRVIVLRREPGGPWTILNVVGLDGVVRLESLSVEMTMREIYRKVEFGKGPMSRPDAAVGSATAD